MISPDISSDLPRVCSIFWCCWRDARVDHSMNYCSGQPDIPQGLRSGYNVWSCTWLYDSRISGSPGCCWYDDRSLFWFAYPFLTKDVNDTHQVSCFIWSHSPLRWCIYSVKLLFTVKHSDAVHYSDVIMGVIACQITNLAIVYSTVYSDADQIKHQSSASLTFVRGIHRSPVNSRTDGQ